MDAEVSALTQSANGDGVDVSDCLGVIDKAVESVFDFLTSACNCVIGMINDAIDLINAAISNLEEVSKLIGKSGDQFNHCIQDVNDFGKIGDAFNCIAGVSLMGIAP